MSQYQDYASSKYLTHKNASFYGCTLGEMGIILCAYAAIEIPFICIIAAMISDYLGGFVGAFLLLFLLCCVLTFFVFLKKTAGFIGKLRQDRAPGFLKLRVRQVMHELLGVKISYIVRSGYWITRRRQNDI